MACGADPTVEVENEALHDVVGDDVDIGLGFSYQLGEGKAARLARARGRLRFFRFAGWFTEKLREHDIALNCYLTTTKVDKAQAASDAPRFNKRMLLDVSPIEGLVLDNEK